MHSNTACTVSYHEGVGKIADVILRIEHNK